MVKVYQANGNNVGSIPAASSTAAVDLKLTYRNALAALLGNAKPANPKENQYQATGTDTYNAVMKASFETDYRTRNMRNESEQAKDEKKDWPIKAPVSRQIKDITIPKGPITPKDYNQYDPTYESSREEEKKEPLYERMRNKSKRYASLMTKIFEKISDAYAKRDYEPQRVIPFPALEKALDHKERQQPGRVIPLPTQDNLDSLLDAA